MVQRLRLARAALLLGLAVLPSAAAFAGYKARPWNLRAPDSYSAKLTSEGVTIAVEPFFRDALAAQVFDKSDMVTRGIMPLGIIIFNDNDFPVMVDGSRIELIQEDDHLRTLHPGEVVSRLFQKGSRSILTPQPIPRFPAGGKQNVDALNDFEAKFLSNKVVGPHDKGGGFLYLHLLESKDIPGYLSRSRIYIPDIYRQDRGDKLIFFEFDLKPAIESAPSK